MGGSMIVSHSGIRFLVLAVCLLILPANGRAQGNLVAQIWNMYRTALVKIEVSGTDNAGTPVPVRQGTGLIVEPNGKIVTALHVVGRATEWRLNPDGKLARVINVYRQDSSGAEQRLGSAAVVEDPQYDIAFLDINGNGYAKVNLDQTEPAVGSEVVAIPWDPASGIGRPARGTVT